MEECEPLKSYNQLHEGKIRRYYKTTSNGRRRLKKAKFQLTLGTTPILDLPYSVNVISRQLIDDTQSRNFKEAAKYLPLVSFLEMQGPEVLRPETRGMQGSNMQNDRKDGMGIAVTTPSALEEYEQLEVMNGLGGASFGPANPSGVFNFVTKRPTEERLGEIELGYEGSSVGTIHTDLGGRFGKNKMFGYRTNLLVSDGNGYVTASQLRRQLVAVAGDIRLADHTAIEGNYSYYNLFQHGYPGWFAYSTTTPLSAPGSKRILLPSDAPDPTREGYGQSFSGVDLTSKIGELRLKHDFSSNWRLTVSALDQLSDRNINTAVNQFLDNSGNYKSYVANSFSSLAPRFHVDSDLLYLTGRFRTARIQHDAVITLLKDAPNRQNAIKFLQLLLSPEGTSALKKNGPDPPSPAIVSSEDFHNLPKPLRPMVRELGK